MRNHNQYESQCLLLEWKKPIKAFMKCTTKRAGVTGLDIMAVTVRNKETGIVLTVFSVTTENFIGTIREAPPPIEIPWTRATY